MAPTSTRSPGRSPRATAARSSTTICCARSSERRLLASRAPRASPTTRCSRCPGGRRHHRCARHGVDRAGHVRGQRRSVERPHSQHRHRAALRRLRSAHERQPWQHRAERPARHRAHRRRHGVGRELRGGRPDRRPRREPSSASTRTSTSSQERGGPAPGRSAKSPACCSTAPHRHHTRGQRAGDLEVSDRFQRFDSAGNSTGSVLLDLPGPVYRNPYSVAVDKVDGSMYVRSSTSRCSRDHALPREAQCREPGHRPVHLQRSRRRPGRVQR